MVIPNAAVKFILLQRTGYLKFGRMRVYRVLRRALPSFVRNQTLLLESLLFRKRTKRLFCKGMAEEYEIIRKHLPCDCDSLLDIGCGVGGIDVCTYRHYEPKSIDLYMLDKTHIERNVFYGFNEKAAVYNSLLVAKELLISNGVPERRINLIEATDNNDIAIDKQVDLVISLLSWGFHYPIGLYLDSVQRILRKNGKLVVDIRKNTDGMDLLEKAFGNTQVISESQSQGKSWLPI